MKKEKPKSGIKKERRITTNGLLTFFFIFFIINLFISTVMAASSGGDSWKMMLFHSGNYTDLYMDFFNSIRDAGDPNVYTARNNIYPPLCLLLFKFMGHFVSRDLVDLPNTRRTLLQTDQRCMMIYILFACFCIFILTFLMEKYAKNLHDKDGVKTHFCSVLTFLTIVSYPVMYCLERGNIIILSMILTMFFVFFRDSNNILIRELSYISLAAAAGIKIYPAIFGVLLLFDKKYKDALRLILYGIILCLVPFVFFIDFNNGKLVIQSGVLSVKLLPAALTDSGESTSVFQAIIQNLMSFATGKKNRLNFSSVSIQNFIFLFEPTNTTLAKIVCAITEFIAIVGLFFVKKKWQQTFLICYLMLNIPSASSSYALTFLLMPFMMFLYDDVGNGYNGEKRNKIDCIYIASFALLFSPLPTFWYYRREAFEALFANLGIQFQTKVNQLVAGFIFQFMFFIIIIEIISMFCQKKKENKRKTITDSPSITVADKDQ